MRKLSKFQKSDLDDSLKYFGSNYFRDMMRRPKPPDEVKYGKNHLQIGKRINDDGSEGGVYYLDIKEGLRILVLGATRCLEENTLVKTRRGNIKIGLLLPNDEVMSYNIEKKKMEWSKIKLYPIENPKELFEIELDDGRKIQASKEHTFFVKTDNGIKEKKLEDIDLNKDLLVDLKNG